MGDSNEWHGDGPYNHEYVTPGQRAMYGAQVLLERTVEIARRTTAPLIIAAAIGALVVNEVTNPGTGLLTEAVQFVSSNLHHLQQSIASTVQSHTPTTSSQPENPGDIITGLQQMPDNLKHLGIIGIVIPGAVVTGIAIKAAFFPKRDRY